MEILKTTHYDFLGKTRIAVTASLLLILAGFAYIYKNGFHYGVEFSGGTQLIVKFQSAPEIDKVRRAVETVSNGATIQTYDQPAKNQVLIRLAGVGEGNEDLSKVAQDALKALATQYTGNSVLESSTEIVGPIVGEELRRKAIQLTVWGLLFQLIYIAWRFKGASWGAGATVAVLHDVLVTLGLLAMFRFEITLNVIAALLTLVGYSVNDTIVIFDRVRENLRQRRKDSLATIINESINQTLSRTLISNGTTFLTVLGLFLFGGEVLRGFGFTMVVGILVGTYSTIYIASPVVIWWDSLTKNRKGGSSSGGASAKAAL
jgi:preprotein translocase subunit SecF